LTRVGCLAGDGSNTVGYSKITGELQDTATDEEEAGE
jgi:hypothetical protein